MKDWLISVRDHFQNPNTILCSSPSRLSHRSLMSISDEEFCFDPTIKLILVVTFPMVSVFVLVLVAAGLVYRCRYRLYTKWNFHPFDRDECVGEEMDYDVFLCCSSLDNVPHGRDVFETLTRENYRVCFHEDDFIPGQRILDNISRAVERSKRTLCLLTQNFIRSVYCLNEFHSAVYHSVSLKRNRVIVLMMLDDPHQLLSNDSKDLAALCQHLRQYTYIVYGADGWLQRLMYALPVNRVAKTNTVEAVYRDAGVEDDDMMLVPDAGGVEEADDTILLIR